MRLRQIADEDVSGTISWLTGELIPSLEAEAYIVGVDGGQDAIMAEPEYSVHLNRDISLRVIDLEARLDELEAERDAHEYDASVAAAGSKAQYWAGIKLANVCRRIQDAERDIEVICSCDDRVLFHGTANAEADASRDKPMTNASRMAELIDILRNHAMLAYTGEYREALIGNTNVAGNFRGMTPANKQHESVRIERAVQWYNSLFLFAEENLSKNKKAKGTDMVHEYATEQLLKIAYGTTYILNILRPGTYWYNESTRYTKQKNAYLNVKEANSSISAISKSVALCANGCEVDYLSWLEEQPVNHAQERQWLTEDEIISHLDKVPRPWLYTDAKDNRPHTL